MKYIKYIILVLVILIIITIVVILNVMHSDEYIYTDDIEEEGLPIDLIQKVAVLENRNNYYVVKKIIENYYSDLSNFNMKKEDLLGEGQSTSYLKNISDDALKSEIEAYKEKVYNYLDSEYKEKNGITISNIQDKIGKYDNVQVIIDNIYYLDSNENVRVYFVYGETVQKETLRKEQFRIMLTVDSQNSAFEIYPSGYGYNVELGKELKIDKKEIKNVVYNSYKFSIIEDETFAKELFSDYKSRLMYDAETAYERLDDEYKAKKVQNVEEYKTYVKNNYYRFINANVVKYQIDYMDDYIQVICIDDKENNYIFKVQDVANYTIIPDTYTIDIPEFVANYEKSSTEEKVGLDINKFMLALNDKDYKYLYSILADSFKENNFKTYEEFENYAKTNFFEENTFGYLEFGNEGGTYYTYKVKISDATQKNDKTIEKTFIVLLGEGTDFKISFNVK